MANNGKFLNLENGKLKQNEAIDISVGAADVGKIIKLDSAGRIDPSVLPVGVGPDVKVLETSENLAAGDYVNIYDDVGVSKVRLADGSNGRDAHGFVKAVHLTASNATVFFEGANEDLTGLTAGDRQYLGVTGGATTVPRTTGIHQFLGIAISTTAVNTDIDDCIQL